MTKEELEIIKCALVQLLIKHKEEEKQIETIINKLDDEIEVID